MADTACWGDFGTAGERRFVRSVEVKNKILKKLKNIFKKVYNIYIYVCIFAACQSGRNLTNLKNQPIMLHIKITFKPSSRVGNGMIAANSVMVADITPKLNVWEAYGDQEIAEMWASQILQQRFAESCTLIQAEVYKP